MCRTEYTTMWSFKTANFEILWEVAPCDDCDLSWDETGEVLENLQSGLWVAFDSKVSVHYRGDVVAADYLSQSIYENPSEFRDHIGCKGKGHGSYFSDMVHSAVKEAREHLAKPRPYIRATAA